MKKNIFKILSATALVGMTTLSLTSCKFVDTIKGWFDDEPVEPQEPTTPSDVNVDGENVEQGQSVPLPKNAIFKKASHRTALTVKATVLPTDATQKSLTWSLAWKTASSETISNYVTISPSADTLSCSITVKKGFNIPINLTARTKDGTSATCQLDFLKQVESYKIDWELVDEGQSINTGSYTFNYSFGEDSKTFSEDANGSDEMGYLLHFWNYKNSVVDSYYGDNIGYCGDAYPVRNNVLKTVGTVGEVRSYYSDLSGFTTATDQYYTISFTDAAKNALTNAGYSSYMKSVNNEASSSLSDNLMYNFFDSSRMTDTIAKGIINTLKSVSGDILKITFTFQSWYGGQCMNSQTAVYSARADICSYVPTTSVSFDNSIVVAS